MTPFFIFIIFVVMNVDVKIYMAQIKKFFDENPNDLGNLIPLNLKEQFYERVEVMADSNSKEGKEIPLTRKQLIDICVELNGNPKKKDENIFIETEFGKLFLN